MSQPEFDSPLPGRDLDRRSAVETAVGSGSAAAVRPGSAQTIEFRAQVA